MDERKEQFRARTKAYALAVVRLYCELPKTRTEVQILGKQRVQFEALVNVHSEPTPSPSGGGESDFSVPLLGGVGVGSAESFLWLELLNEGCGVRSPAIKALHSETNELIAIFVTMAKNAKKGMNAET